MNTSREDLLSNMEGDVVDSTSASVSAQAKPSEQRSFPEDAKKSPSSSEDGGPFIVEVSIQKQQSDSESSEKTLGGSSSQDDEPITTTLTPQQERLTSPNPSTTIIIEPTACTDVADAPCAAPLIRPSDFRVEDPVERYHSFWMCIFFCVNYDYPLHGVNIFKYLVVAYFALFCFAASILVLGFMSVDDCPAAPNAGMHVFVIGLLTTLTLGGKLLEACHQCVLQRPVRWFPRSISVSVFVGAFILLIFEMMAMYKFRPSAELSSKDYCDPMFYQYTYYANFAGIIIMFVMSACFCARACRDSNDGPDYVMRAPLRQSYQGYTVAQP